jgi:hypothetical protein
VISLNLGLAGLRLGLKNRQVGEKWVADDCSYLCKGLDATEYFYLNLFDSRVIDSCPLAGIDGLNQGYFH